MNEYQERFWLFREIWFSDIFGLYPDSKEIKRLFKINKDIFYKNNHSVDVYTILQKLRENINKTNINFLFKLKIQNFKSLESLYNLEIQYKKEKEKQYCAFHHYLFIYWILIKYLPIKELVLKILFKKSKKYIHLKCLYIVNKDYNYTYQYFRFDPKDGIFPKKELCQCFSCYQYQQFLIKKYSIINNITK
jgi:hypothetical protein